MARASDDVALDRAEDRERVDLQLRRHVRRGVRMHDDRRVREPRAQDRRVGEDADRCADAAEVQFRLLAADPRRQRVREGEAAERGLVHDDRARLLREGPQCRRDLPALRPLEAVRDRELAPLQRLRVVPVVRVARERDGVPSAPREQRADGLRRGGALGVPQASREEVVLHVDDDQYPFHGRIPFNAR